MLPETGWIIQLSSDYSILLTSPEHVIKKDSIIQHIYFCESNDNKGKLTDTLKVSYKIDIIKKIPCGESYSSNTVLQTKIYKDSLPNLTPHTVLPYIKQVLGKSDSNKID